MHKQWRRPGQRVSRRSFMRKAAAGAGAAMAAEAGHSTTLSADALEPPQARQSRTPATPGGVAPPTASQAPPGFRIPAEFAAAAGAAASEFLP
jgi:hypothetical protein